MELKVLKNYLNKRVRVLLKNNFSYRDVVISITEDQLIEFQDNHGEVVLVEPSFVVAVTEAK